MEMLVHVVQFVRELVHGMTILKTRFINADVRGEQCSALNLLRSDSLLPLVDKKLLLTNVEN